MHRKCDECGRTAHRIIRNDRGHRYCATCYAQCFKRRACSACGVFARIHTKEEHPQCEACRWAAPCVRCGRPGRELGRRTEFGPVCNACSPYFREKAACAICGVLSSRTVRAQREGLPIHLCGRCGSTGHQTCHQCRRHRPVAGLEGWRPVCAGCKGGAVSTCRDCGGTMPAGRRARCETCYFRDLLRRRAKISSAALSAPRVSSAFLQYADWLGEHAGPVRAARLIVKHLSFFREIEKRWVDVPMSGQLLEAFGTPGLRRHLLVMKFLEDRRRDGLSVASKVESSEWKRINAVLDGIPPKTPAHALLCGYRIALLAKYESGGIKLTSLRLSLRAAKGLVLASVENPRSLPDQGSVENYLRARPGQRAAVSGFVTYIRREGGHQLILPKARARTSVQERQRVEAALRQLILRGALKTGEECRLLSLALRYFHGVSRKAAERVSRPMALTLGAWGAWYIAIDGHRYVLPNEVAERCRTDASP